MQYADYLTASLGDMQQALAQRRVSARQLTTFALQRIADVDQPRYNAISWLFADDALAAAAASDAARQQNAPVGPLAGIPLLIKDNIEVKGWPTSAGSALLRDVIASEDAPLVTALHQAGAILIGKTTMHELAAGITGASSLSGFTHNAWQQGRSPGGSSSGSAVAVAAGFVPLAIGSDTAGSVRIPAAFNGLFGLRMTRGALSSAGIVPLSPTQDIPGPLVRYAADLRLISEILTGQRFSRPDRALRIGIWQEGFAAEETEINQAVQDAVAPFQPRMLSWPQLETLATEANIIAYEFADALAAWLADKPQAPLRTLAAIAASGRYHPQLEATFKTRAQHPGMKSDGYREVQLRQQRLYQQLAQFFQQQQIDLLAYPVVRHPPVKHGELQPGSNALISAVTGAPAISIPVGLSTEGLPIGLELLALRDREDVLLMAAEQIEQAHPPFNHAAPAL
ncbi:amidase [Pantoea dispersa]|uniref:Amidase n=1 Tax=Pantoea dispersa TaxID=59814 RepID=A0A8E1V841_9GAMM|nr:amidase [Pantoea dispersa]KTR88237.1 amidase [Pantoea dispersa]KTS22829.1 amidase [Pantoea dispersa]KTS57568.1 amidase [Pantoea dispersa]KTS66412.1 amidase [Pantoea dispersa]